jgi:hypothetical protein
MTRSHDEVPWPVLRDLQKLAVTKILQDFLW